jgi:hypothetical protein
LLITYSQQVAVVAVKAVSVMMKLMNTGCNTVVVEVVAEVLGDLQVKLFLLIVILLLLEQAVLAVIQE